MIIDIQHSAGSNDWPVLRDATLRAEAEGFGTTWVLDHFDGATLGGDRPMLECFTLLGALSQVTTTIGLGTLVVNVANRHPALLALAASTVERMCGDRFTLGVGAGAAPASKFARELVERGIPLLDDAEQRHANVLRNIEVLRGHVSCPIIVGVNSVALARLAGRMADGVNVRMNHPRAAEVLDAAREAAGDRPFDVSGWSGEPLEEARVRAERLGLDRLILSRLGPLAATL